MADNITEKKDMGPERRQNRLKATAAAMMFAATSFLGGKATSASPFNKGSGNEPGKPTDISAGNITVPVTGEKDPSFQTVSDRQNYSDASPIKHVTKSEIIEALPNSPAPLAFDTLDKDGRQFVANQVGFNGDIDHFAEPIGLGLDSNNNIVSPLDGVNTANFTALKNRYQELVQKNADTVQKTLQDGGQINVWMNFDGDNTSLSMESITKGGEKTITVLVKNQDGTDKSETMKLSDPNEKSRVVWNANINVDPNSGIQFPPNSFAATAYIPASNGQDVLTKYIGYTGMNGEVGEIDLQPKTNTLSDGTQVTTPQPNSNAQIMPTQAPVFVSYELKPNTNPELSVDYLKSINAPNSRLIVDAANNVISEEKVASYQYGPDGVLYGLNNKGEIIVGDFTNNPDMEIHYTISDKGFPIKDDKAHYWFSLQINEVIDINGQKIPFKLWQSMDLSDKTNVTNQFKSLVALYGPNAALNPKITAMVNNVASTEFTNDAKTMFGNAINYLIQNESKDGKTIQTRDGSTWKVFEGGIVAFETRNFPKKYTDLGTESINIGSLGHSVASYYVDKNTGALVIPSMWLHNTGGNLTSSFIDSLQLAADSKVQVAQKSFGPELIDMPDDTFQKFFFNGSKFNPAFKMATSKNDIKPGDVVPFNN